MAENDNNVLLEKLEQRITRAISHIEELTKKNQNLETENTALVQETERLQSVLQDKNDELEQCRRESSEVAVRVREKVETLLQKIDAYEQSLA